MRQIKILDGPRRAGLRRMPLTLPEENQLESEPFTARSRHITGVIPPFRAKVLMLKVVPWKLVGIAGDSFAIRETGGEQRENIQRNYERPQTSGYRRQVLP